VAGFDHGCCSGRHVNSTHDHHGILIWTIMKNRCYDEKGHFQGFLRISEIILNIFYIFKLSVIMMEYDIYRIEIAKITEKTAIATWGSGNNI